MHPLDVEVIAGITLTGTSELIEAVQRGVYPATPTFVVMHLPDVPRPARRLTEGMRPLDNRRCILACFEALKRFVLVSSAFQTIMCS